MLGVTLDVYDVVTRCVLVNQPYHTVKQPVRLMFNDEITVMLRDSFALISEYGQDVTLFPDILCSQLPQLFKAEDCGTWVTHLAVWYGCVTLLDGNFVKSAPRWPFSHCTVPIAKPFSV
ncbi:hypothetical protein Bbelb_104270 [Branchiostoma belcheri]|nr:hypothetical protein Bbelb_104270 [Branchiostoma belcheri]